MSIRGGKSGYFGALARAAACATLAVGHLLSAAAQTPPNETDRDPGKWAARQYSQSSIQKRSHSKVLELPADRRALPPLEAQEPFSDTQSVNSDPLTIVRYVAATRQIIRTELPRINSSTFTTDMRTIDAFEGLLPQAPSLLSTTGIDMPDRRERVADTTAFPWRSIVHLVIQFPTGGGTCSGALVDSFHVLTAGHCIHQAASGGWATSVEVIPGLDETYMPYHHAWMTDLRSYTGWTENQMAEHDWALITLDRNIGNLTGWMGRQTAGSSSGIYGQLVNSAGYPGAKCAGDCMYHVSGNGKGASEFRHFYEMCTTPGQSGSPVWRYETASQERYIVSIATLGNTTCAADAHSGTRLGNDKYDRLSAWIAEDTPPQDFADLIDDGETYAGFSPSVVWQGSSVRIWNDVRNVGTANSSPIKVSYYASRDWAIGPDDYLIGIASSSEIAAQAWQNVEWSGRLPSAIPAGKYWIVWRIDSAGNTAEFEETNNEGVITSAQITVVNRMLMPLVRKR